MLYINDLHPYLYSLLDLTFIYWNDALKNLAICRILAAYSFI